MIKEQEYKSFTEKFSKKQGPHPVSVQTELTYKCNLNCIHCYCKSSESNSELTTGEWKSILDELYSAGIIYLTLTGGEPLLRPDFFDIYDYARKKGFLIILFTNAVLLDSSTIKYFAKKPPLSIEVTLNGITKATYERISQVEHSFEKAMENIKKLAKSNLPLVLKTVGLKENKAEILKIKAFSENLLSKKRFKFDSFIIPALTGGLDPCEHRLQPEEIREIEEKDPDMKKERLQGLKKEKLILYEEDCKYQCNAHHRQAYITPSGMLRFCHLTDKFSSSLKEISFKETFYEKFSAIHEERFTTESKCKACSLREFCHHCPARAYLETGNEEMHVDYYCQLARLTKERKI